MIPHLILYIIKGYFHLLILLNTTQGRKILCHNLIKKNISIRTSFRKPTLVDSKERFSWISGQQQCSRQKKEENTQGTREIIRLDIMTFLTFGS